MKPEIVTEAPMPPGQCLFSQDQEGPWIDTGLMAPWIKPYGYLGVKYVEGLARDLLDMVPRSEVEKKIGVLKATLDRQAEEIEELQGVAAAINHLTDVTETVKDFENNAPLQGVEN